MNLLEIIRKHQQAHPHRERSERSEERADTDGVYSHLSLNSHPTTLPAANRCADWLQRFIRGRYPKLADVKTAALREGFTLPDVEQALTSAAFVLYQTFPRRHIGEVDHVRSADDWPDDPPLRNN